MDAPAKTIAEEAGLKPVGQAIARAMDRVAAAVEKRQGTAALAAMERAGVDPKILAWIERCRLFGLRFELDPGCRPGERMLRDRVYVYDAGLLGDYLACEAVLSAPDDLSRLADGDVRLLRLSASGVRAMECGAPGVWDDVMVRCTAELKRRGCV